MQRFKAIRGITESRYGMDLRFLPTSRSNSMLTSALDNARGSFEAWAILIYARNLTRAKGTRIQRRECPLKKTLRNRRRRLLDSCIPGRSTLPDSDHCGLWLVQERQRSYSQVLPWPIQDIIQWLCHSGKWDTFHGKA